MNIIITINSRWIFQSRKYLLTQTFKVFTIQSLQKSIKFPFCLNNSKCKSQLKANAGLLQPARLWKLRIPQNIGSNQLFMRMCVDDLSRIEIHNLMESCDQVLIKVKDSAPTAVICTLAIKIAKHREEGGGGGEFCKTRHTGKILISFSSTLWVESALDHAGASFKFSMYRVFMFSIFCCDDARDRWFIKTNFAPSPQQHPGWRRVGSNEHDTKFMPTSLRGVPNQNLWFTSSFSRSEHRHWHNWWGTGVRMWIPWTHLHVKTKYQTIFLSCVQFLLAGCTLDACDKVDLGNLLIVYYVY